jgi:hypothetical protein
MKATVIKPNENGREMAEEWGCRKNATQNVELGSSYTRRRAPSLTDGKVQFASCRNA